MSKSDVRLLSTPVVESVRYIPAHNRLGRLAFAVLLAGTGLATGRVAQAQCVVAGQCIPCIWCVPDPPENCRDYLYCCNDDRSSCGCSTQTSPEGTTCNDDDNCTVGDTCSGGGCVPGLSCAEAFPVCVPECGSWECRPDGFMCEFVPNEGASCSTLGIDAFDPICLYVTSGICDGVCNSQGACLPDPAIMDCESPSCDDGLACTCDSCGNDGCVNTAPCDDGNFCNGRESCNDVTTDCIPGTPPDCDDNKPCTVDSCDAMEGCKHEIRTGTCDDGNFCTTADICVNGVCAGTPTVCADDGDPCNGTEACTSDGCTLSPPLVCYDGNICTADTCVPMVGCVFQPQPGPCDDGLLCTLNDQCFNGLCAGMDLNCDDGLFCNGAEFCDPVLGCQSSPDIDCNDHNSCTDDSCSNVMAQCINASWCDNVADADSLDDPPVPPSLSDKIFVNNFNGLPLKVSTTTSFPVDVTRYAGATQSTGQLAPSTLANFGEMVAAGVLRGRARLKIATIGISAADGGTVSFNGQPVDTFGGGLNPNASVAGDRCHWSEMCFEIPIEKVNFPVEPGQGGAAPVPATNVIGVEVLDPDPAQGVICRRIGNVSLEIWIMSQGQRTLSPLRRKDLHQKLVAPSGYFTLPFDAVL